MIQEIDVISFECFEEAVNELINTDKSTNKQDKSEEAKEVSCKTCKYTDNEGCLNPKDCFDFSEHCIEINEHGTNFNEHV
jgi:hypothetical protein